MTELQQALMDRIHAALEARPEGPTTEEVLQDFRYRHPGNVQRSLEGLVTAGHLQCVKGRWRLKTPDVQLHFPLGGNEPWPAGQQPR